MRLRSVFLVIAELGVIAAICAQGCSTGEPGEPVGQGSARLGLTRDPTCDASSLTLYPMDAGADAAPLCLAGTGWKELSAFNWPYQVAAFKPGANPGLFSFTTCPNVRCQSQSFAADGGMTTLGSQFQASDAGLVAVYSLPAFPQTWSGPHMFVESDEGMAEYTGQDAGTAATILPGLLTQPVPLDFIWAGDRFADCWAQNPDAGDAGACTYGGVCIVGGLCGGEGCDGGYPCLGGGCNTSGPVPYCTGYSDSGDQYCVNSANCPTDKSVYANSVFGAPQAMGLSPPGAPALAATWQPVVGHYQALNSAPSVAFDVGLARCIDGGVYGGDGGEQPCLSCKVMDLVGVPDGGVPGYYQHAYLFGADGGPDPVCVELMAGSVDTGCSGASASAMYASEFVYWHARPRFMLYKVVGGTIADDLCHVATFDTSPGKYTPGLDISNPDVANELVGRIVYWPGRLGTGYAPYGALSIDTVDLANYSSAQFVCDSGTGCPTCEVGDEQCLDEGGWLPRFNGDGRFDPLSCDGGDLGLPGYCDPAWTQAVLDWIARLRDEAHRVGRNLVVNVGYGGTGGSARPFAYIPPNDPALLTLFGYVDGVLDETGFTQGEAAASLNACGPTWMVNDDSLTCNGTCGPYTYGTTSSTTCDRWSDFASPPGQTYFSGGGYMRVVQSLGKPYFNKSFSPNMAESPSDGGSPFLWSLASHLLARGNTQSEAREAFFASQVTAGNELAAYLSPLEPNSSALYSALAAFAGDGGPGSSSGGGIGHPCEEVQIPQTHVYTRKFSGGWVVVNANGPDGGTASLTRPTPLTGSWPDGGTSSVSVPSASGAILMLQSGSLCCDIGTCPTGCCYGGGGGTCETITGPTCGVPGSRCILCPPGTSCDTADGTCYGCTPPNCN